jgi:hypothetical protein
MLRNSRPDKFVATGRLNTGEASHSPPEMHVTPSSKCVIHLLVLAIGFEMSSSYAPMDRFMAAFWRIPTKQEDTAR